MNPYNQQGGQSYQNYERDQNNANKQLNRSNPSYQYDNEHLNRFPARDQANNLNFRNQQDSGYSNPSQGRAQLRTKPNYVYSGSNQYQSNDRGNAGNQGNTYVASSNNQRNAGQKVYNYSYSNEQNNQQATAPGKYQYNQNPQNTYGPNEEAGRRNDRNIQQNFAPVNRAGSFGNNQPNSTYNMQNNRQVQSGYQNQDQQSRGNRIQEPNSHYGPELTRSHSDTHVPPENRKNDLSLQRPVASDGSKVTSRTNDYSPREQQAAQHIQTSPFNPENRSDLSKSYNTPTEGNYQSHTDNRHNEAEERPLYTKETAHGNIDVRANNQQRMYEKKSKFERGNRNNSPNISKDDQIVIKIPRSDVDSTNQIYRVGDGLFIPGFFSSSLSGLTSLPKLVTQDSEGKFVSTHDLIGFSINITVKNYSKNIPFQKFSVNLLNRSLEKDSPPNLLQFEVESLPTDVLSQKNIQHQPTEVQMQGLDTKMDEEKRTSTELSKKSSGKTRDVSSDSGDDETMFKNQLDQNNHGSLSLKQKVAKGKNRTEKTIEKAKSEQHKPTKLSFEIDLNPVAWITEEEQPRKVVKTESNDSSAQIPKGEEELEEPETQSPAKVKRIKSVTNPSSRPSSYRVLGQETTRYTRESNLFEKLGNYLIEKEKIEAEPKQEPVVNQAEQEAAVAEDEAQKTLDEHYSFDNRYFINNPTKVCHRCRQPGHFERMCPEAIKIMCLFCCKNHDTQDCDEIVCFRCSKKGHRSKDCREYESMTCFRCEKRGHKNVQCGVILPPKNHYADEKILREKRSTRHDGLCITCGKFGHYNCNNVNLVKGEIDKIDDFYCGEDTIVKELKEELQKKNGTVPEISNAFEEHQGVSEEESNDSVDDEDKKYLKRSGEKKNGARKSNMTENISIVAAPNTENTRDYSENSDGFSRNYQGPDFRSNRPGNRYGQNQGNRQNYQRPKNF